MRPGSPPDAGGKTRAPCRVHVAWSQAPPDNTFWWLQTDVHGARQIQAEWAGDDAHFFGLTNYDGDDRILFSLATFGSKIAIRVTPKADI
jgi:hypothetical protein